MKEDGVLSFFRRMFMYSKRKKHLFHMLQPSVRLLEVKSYKFNGSFKLNLSIHLQLVLYYLFIYYCFGLFMLNSLCCTRIVEKVKEVLIPPLHYACTQLVSHSKFEVSN